MSRYKPLTEQEAKDLRPIFLKIKEENGKAWKKLSERCMREQTGPLFLIREYGHPENWK
jgi:hypothetical protein